MRETAVATKQTHGNQRSRSRECLVMHKLRRPPLGRMFLGSMFPGMRLTRKVQPRLP